MKKYIIGSLLIFSFLLPVTSFAQVASEDIAMPPLTCYNIVNNLKYKDRDVKKNGEVTVLQNFLRSKKYLNSPATGYFGLLTFKSVKTFQRANSISPTGFVGPITRAKIKALTCGGATVSKGSISIISTTDNIVNTGYSATFQAMYQPPMPFCPGDACIQMMPAPYPVKATWTTSNTKIATVSYKDNCPVGAQCLVYQPDYLTAQVNGLTEGDITLTAEYKDASGNLVATKAITVRNPIR